MTSWNGLWRTAVLVGLTTTSVTVLPAAAADPAPPQTAKQQAAVGAYIDQLADEDYQLREAATEALRQLGSAAVKPLAAASICDNSETAWRATSVLQAIASTGDEQTLMQIAQALSELKSGGRPAIGKMIAEVQQRHAQLRIDRAVAKVESLGALIGDSNGSRFGVVGGPIAFGPGRIDFHGGIVGEAIWVEADSVVAEVAAPEAMVLTEPVPAAIAEPALSEPAIAELGVSGTTVPVANAQLPATVEADPNAPPDPSDSPQISFTDVEFAPDAGSPVPDPAAPPDELREGPPVGPELAGPLDPAAVPSATPRSIVSSLSLGKSWRGGDAGVALLSELPQLARLEIDGAELTDEALPHLAKLTALQSLRVRNSAITSTGLRKLRVQRPTLLITPIGSSMLGVSADVAGERCLVTTVFDNSGAKAAGLQPGDRIVRVDGAKIATFIDLMIEIYGRKPGEKIAVGYERGEPAKNAVATVELKPRAELEAIRR